MRAVIFAAALLAVSAAWLSNSLEFDLLARSTLNPSAAPSSELKSLYRAQYAQCKGEPRPERKACERNVRESVLAHVKRAAAKVSLR